MLIPLLVLLIRRCWFQMRDQNTTEDIDIIDRRMARLLTALSREGREYSTAASLRFMRLLRSDYIPTTLVDQVEEIERSRKENP